MCLPRLVTVLCLIQFGCILGGFVSTRFLCRQYEKACGHRLSFPFPVRVVRSHGPWFLLATAGWGIAAISKRRKVGRGEAIHPGLAIAGLALTALVVVLFAWSSSRAFGLLLSG